MSKTIMVTGGAGYIGSHVCKELKQRGYFPVVFDNLSTGHTWAVKWGALEVGDIADESLLNQALLSHKPTAVIHLAASAYVGESVINPMKYYQNNVCGTTTLLKTLVEHGIKQLIFSSTCATYGHPQQLPLTEDHNQDPINPYGRSKYMVEQILRDYDFAYGVKSISLRYFNAAGADLSGDIGELHIPETHLIPLVIEAALQKKILTVFGNDYETQDGTCIRDYIHVSDIARAHVLALERLENQQTSDTFNLGSETGKSVFEVITCAEDVLGLPVPIAIQARRDGDPPILVADASKARKVLGWNSESSDLVRIFESAHKWYERSRNLN